MSEYWKPGVVTRHREKDWVCVACQNIPARYWKDYVRAWEVGVYNDHTQIWSRSCEMPDGNYAWAGTKGGTTMGNYLDGARNISCVIPASYMEPEFNEHGEVAP